MGCAHVYLRSYREGSHRKFISCHLCGEPLARKDEGWTSTLAKLIGPEPEPEESDAVKWCGCRCHKPGGIAGPDESCLACAYMHNSKTL